jgi:hypothetical protein
MFFSKKENSKQFGTISTKKREKKVPEKRTKLTGVFVSKKENGN